MRRLRRSVLKAARERARRHSRLHPLLGPSVGLGLFLAATGASAQSRSDDIPLPPLDVEGQRPSPYRTEPQSPKLQEDVKDVPQSITIVPKRVIQEQSVTTLRDALRNVTGISLQAGEGGGAQGDNLSLRGFPARTDIFVDNVRDSAQYTRDIFNLEAVEVLKGPSAVFYGRGSTGGVINQVSKTPQRNSFYEFSLGGSNGPSIRATADVNYAFSPSAALRLNGMVSGGEVVDRDEIHYTRWGFAPSVAFGLGTPTKVVFSYYYQAEDSLPDYGHPILLGEPPDVPRNNYYGLSQEDYERTHTNLLTATLDHEFNESISSHSIVRYGWYDREVFVTPPRILGTPTPATPLSQITVNRTRPGREVEESILAFQTDVLFKFETGPLKHRLVSGIDVARQEFDSQALTAAPTTTTPLLNPDGEPDVTIVTAKGVRTDAKATSLGLYVVDDVALTKWLRLMAGVRWDYFDAALKTFDGNGIRTALRSSTDTMFSPRAALILQPTPAQTYYVSYGESFNPSAEQLNSINAANESLDPEKNRSYEVGAKYDLFKGGLGLSAAIFRIEKTNARTADPLDPLLQVLAGNARSDGFEVGAAGRVLPGWNIFAGYTYLDTEIVEANDGTEGNELANAPRHTVSLWTTYDFLERWQVGTGVFYTSKRFGNNQNTSQVPGYVRWDATAAYHLTKNIELRFNIVNITDAYYYDRIHPSHVIPGDGRTFALTANFRF